MSVTEKELTAIFISPQTRDKAFRIIVDNYKERLYWHIRKIVIRHEDADDILQNSFIKALENADNFRGDSSLFTWLFRIATNESLDFLRKEKRMSMHSWEDLGKKLYNGLENDPYFNGDDVQRKLQEAVLSLPERQRLVFNMKYFDGMKYEQMAEILELSVGALKASYHHAVKKILIYFDIH